LGRREEALAALKKHDDLRPGWTIERMKVANVVTDGTPRARLFEPIFVLLRGLGMPER
jgi:hypothetical protein